MELEFYIFGASLQSASLSYSVSRRFWQCVLCQGYRNENLHVFDTGWLYLSHVYLQTCPVTGCALLAETLLYPRFSGRHNLRLRRAYIKGQAENMLILRYTHLNLGGNKYFKYLQSSTRPFDMVGATRWMCVCKSRVLVCASRITAS